MNLEFYEELKNFLKNIIIIGFLADNNFQSNRIIMKWKKKQEKLFGWNFHPKILKKNFPSFLRQKGEVRRSGKFSDDVDRRLALMVQIGLRPAEIAWALEMSIDNIEVQLKNLSRHLGGHDPVAKSVSDEETSHADSQSVVWRLFRRNLSGNLFSSRPSMCWAGGSFPLDKQFISMEFRHRSGTL